MPDAGSDSSELHQAIKNRIPVFTPFLPGLQAWSLTGGTSRPSSWTRARGPRWSTTTPSSSSQRRRSPPSSPSSPPSRLPTRSMDDKTCLSLDPDPHGFIQVNLDQHHGFLILSNLFCCLFQLQDTLHKVFKAGAGSGSALLRSWIRIRMEKNSWIRIRKKWMRIHNPGSGSKQINYLSSGGTGKWCCISVYTRRLTKIYQLFLVDPYLR